MAVSKKRKKSSNKNNRPTANKLSGVIMEFVKPLAERINSMKRYKSMLEFGILVWNISLFSLEDRGDQKDEVMKRLNVGKDEQIKDDLNEIYNYLIYRKDTIFKSDKRFIVNYEIVEHENRCDLTIGLTKFVQ